jgi:hypothetical protein
VLGIVPVRIETEATTEASIPPELILGNSVDELDEPAMNVLLAAEHLGQR